MDHGLPGRYTLLEQQWARVDGSISGAVGLTDESSDAEDLAERQSGAHLVCILNGQKGLSLGVESQ